jgi:hypothetical protein
MLVLHFEGPTEVAPREWLDTAHPALAAHAGPWRQGRASQYRLVQPLLLGGHRDTQVVLPGLEPLHATLGQPRPGELEVRVATPTALVKVDGGRVIDVAPLPLGAALELGPWTVRVARTASLTGAEQARLAALAQVADGWRVLADELEEAGETALAEWLRLERSVTDESRVQLRVKGAEVPLSRRAMVASAAVLNCERPAAGCPGTWDRLTPGAEPCLRACAACGATALYSEDESEAARFALRGEWRVVLDAGRPQPRKPWPMVTIG